MADEAERIRPSGERVAPAAEPRTLALPDGRTLAWSEVGAPAGRPLFYCHGFPGSRLELALGADAIARADARVIAIDRPGVGRSSPRPGRRLLDWPADVACVADALGLERFWCLGVSGGGPYALACAHALAPRIERVGVVCGLGPFDDPAARRGMLRVNRVLFALARGPRPLVRLLVAPQVAALRRDPERALRRLLPHLAAPDRAALAAPGRLQKLAASAAEALRQGAGPFADEAALYVRSWGFRLEDVGAEVRLHQGELDVNVPAGMGRAQAARLPRCSARFYPDEGHYSLVLRHLAEIVGDLLDGRRGG